MIDAERELRLRTLADRVVEPVRRYLARRCDAATADEVLGDVLVVCWRRLDEVPSEPAESIPWAIGVARNLLANAERAQRRRDRLTAKVIALDPPPLAVLDAGDGEPTDDAIAVRDALTRLRRDDAELLRLWAWDELESPQLATVLGISANAAAIRLHRAKKRLADELRKSAGPAGHVCSEEGSTDARR
ncbi:sigma-70 family RNA polymerase sigma factor [Microcella frigidaquae]|uniref:RNA polymerase sigma-70 factor (ECF subfamily) n=1 Tax=Microcella frigidaquae TaxID=424758 RepID=A0A840X8T0_9MICO|nr:RNA polymerase sigma-70 factor (ECF subfamily) [Microcella frigidaquae]